MLGPVPARMFGQAASALSAAPQKNWKDRAEYDLYVSITQDTNPKTRLEKLQQWEKQYPKTDWITQRRTVFLTTYAALNDAKEAVEAPSRSWPTDPKDFTALYYIMYFTQALYAQNQSPDVLDEGEKAAQGDPGEHRHASAERHGRPMGEAAAGRRAAGAPESGLYRDAAQELGCAPRPSSKKISEMNSERWPGGLLDGHRDSTLPRRRSWTSCPRRCSISRAQRRSMARAACPTQVARPPWTTCRSSTRTTMAATTGSTT